MACQRHCRFAKGLGIGAAITVGAISGASAGDWTFVPHLSIDEEYSDNVTTSGQNTLQDFITTINSGLSLRGTSARLNSNVDYNLQKLIYDAEDNFSGLNHQLQGTTEFTIVDQLFYFEANSSISQQAIDNSGAFGRNNRTQAGNRTDIIFTQLRPIVRHHFGKYGDFEGSFTQGMTTSSGGNINTRGSGDNDAVNLRFSTGRILPVMPITISFDRNTEDFDSGRNNQQERLNAEISYIFDRRLRAIFEIGDEDNTSSNSTGSTGNGMTWSVGGRWNPGPRTEINGNFGERAFGSSTNYSISHRHRRWVFGLDYSEDIRTRSQELRDLVLVPLTDAFGNPFFDPTANSNILNPEDLSTINEDVSTTERLSASLDYQGRLTSFSFDFYDTQRTRQSGGEESTTRGWNTALNRSLSRRLRLGMSIFYRETETGNVRNNKIIIYNPFVAYTLGPHTELNFAYSYRDGGGPSINDNHIENSLTATVTLHY